VPLVVIGTSHHTIGLDELAALTPLGVPARARLADHPAVAGVLVLATCSARYNRRISAQCSKVITLQECLQGVTIPRRHRVSIHATLTR